MNVIDRTLLNDGFPGSTWGNLGLWRGPEQTYPEACEALALKLAEEARLKPGCSVLDVGFGYGDQLLVWRQRFAVARITAVETDAAGVAAACRKLSGFPDISVLHDDGKLRLPDERYDCVLALDCAYHFDPRSAFFAHASRTLHPGGRLALTDLVLADGARPALLSPLATMCRIPADNLMTQPAYRQALLDMGFCNIRFEVLDREVLGGFAGFAVRLLRRQGVAALTPGGIRIFITAAIAGWLCRRGGSHYMLISASRADVPPLQ